MQIKLEHRGDGATLSIESTLVRVQTSDGRSASSLIQGTCRLIDRTPLSVRVRDGRGSTFGLRLTPDGPELAGEGFDGISLAASDDG